MVIVRPMIWTVMAVPVTESLMLKMRLELLPLTVNVADGPVIFNDPVMAISPLVSVIVLAELNTDASKTISSRPGAALAATI